MAIYCVLAEYPYLATKVQICFDVGVVLRNVGGVAILSMAEHMAECHRHGVFW